MKMIDWLRVKRLNNTRIKPSMKRRLRFATLSMINQILLIALAIAWIVHIAIIARYGAVYFEEDNPVILWAEIIILILITAFAIYIFVLQVRRFGERRRDSDRREGDSG